MPLPLSDHPVVADTATPPPNKKNFNWWCLVLLYCTLSVIGSIGGPLLQRFYFNHGGSSSWLSGLLQSVGCITLLPLLSFGYIKTLTAKKQTPSVDYFMDPILFVSSAGVGVLAGLVSFFYSAGLSSLPVSTATLLFSTQLAFTAFFARIIVKQKITFYSLNAVIVMIMGAVVLALHASNDRPLGETRKKYFIGFLFTMLGALTQGVLLPLVELAYSKSTKPMNYMMVFQFQFVMNLISALIITAGLLITKDNKVISKEAVEFDLGETIYVVVIVATALIYQLSSLGSMGLIGCTSSLFVGIFSAVLVPVTEVGSIIAFGEKFNGAKGLSLALCLWGFTSYFVGEYKKTAKTQPMVELNKV